MADTSVLDVRAEITLKNSVHLTLDSTRIMQESLNIQDEICDLGELSVGGVVAQKISFDLNNFDGLLSGYDFNDATCVLHFVGADTIKKGEYTLHASNVVGYRIEIYGYDHMADAEINEPITTPITLSGLTCYEAIEALGFDIDNFFPNWRYQIHGGVTTATLGENVTKRDALAYICQICGCYARYDHNGDLKINGFNILSFSDDLDGGTFELVQDNYIPYPYPNSTIVDNGITFTVNSDGSITLSGTATANARFYLAHDLSLPNATYTFSGSNITGVYKGVRILVGGNPIGLEQDVGDLSVPFPNNAVMDDVYIKVEAGVSPTGTIYPTLINPNDPYHYITVDTADGGHFKEAYTSNLLPYPYEDTTVTRSGITYRDEGDGRIYAYGTASADSSFTLSEFTLPVGSYAISGSVGGLNSTYNLSLYEYVSGSWQTVMKDTIAGQAVVGIAVVGGTPIRQTNETVYFDVTDDRPYKLVINVKSGTYMGISTTGKMFYPMVYSTEDSVTEWIPYIATWTGGDTYDGGLFGFWNRSDVTILSSEDAYTLTKIMNNPTVSKNRTIVTGVKVSGNNFEKFVGSEGYVIEVDNCPFVLSQLICNEIADNIYNAISGVNFIPFTVSWSADPSVEAGDLIAFDYMGSTFVTICTGFNYTLGNISNIYCNESDLQVGM